MFAEALGNETAASAHKHNASVCSDILTVQANFSSVIEELAINIVLACHMGEKARGQPQFYSINQRFGFIAANKFDRSTPVLILTPDRKYVYLLHDKYAESVVAEPPRKRKPKCRVEENWRCRGVKDDAELHHEAEDEQDEHRFVPTSVTEASNCCQCNPCKEAPDYSDSMMRIGPQRLYCISLSGFDHLKFLGLFNVETEQILLKAANFSIGAFDTESLTVHLDEDPAVRGELDPTVETVSNKKMPRIAVSRQTPVLLSWTDYFRLCSGEQRFRYRMNDDDPEAFVGQFVEDILTSRDEVVAAKYEMMHSLFSWLAVFRKAHHDHFGVPEEEEDGEDEDAKDEVDPAASEEVKRRKKVRIAYKFSIFGLFERHLDELARRYLIFGMNSEAYDMPLLVSSIIVYLKNTGRSKIRLNREGSKVKSLSFEGVTIREAKRLLAPGFSLDSLASMCGLDSEIKKGKFPFDAMRTASFLDEPRLPASAAAWVNTLDPAKSISQEEVDAIQAEFDAKNYNCVGDYLAEYLDKDVLLLLKSMIKLCSSYYEQLGLHPADSNKWTVGSLSFLATQTYQMRHRRVGNFIANNCLLFSVSTSVKREVRFKENINTPLSDTKDRTERRVSVFFSLLRFFWFLISPLS
jgi:hypothetical protein